MDTRENPNVWPHLVVVGGGFAGIQLIRRLKNAPVNITLVDRHNYHTFQPLLYQVASGGLGSDSIGYPFRLIFRRQKNFRFRLATVNLVDLQSKMLRTTTGSISYDYLVLATGSMTNFFGNRQLEKWSMPLKSIPDALNLRSDLLQEFEKAVTLQRHAEQEQHMTFVIVGGGPTGVETSGALAEFKKFVLPHDYPELNPSLMKVYLVEAGPRLLAGMSHKAGKNALKYLRQLGVEVLLNTAVDQYDGEIVRLNNGERLYSTTLIWSAGVKGTLIEGLPPESIAGGRYKTNAYNKVEETKEVFAIGDVAGMYSEQLPKGHPMVAPVAIQQGRLLAENIKRMLKGKEMKPFRYFDKGSMATVGRNKAVVDFPFWRFGGLLAWLAWMFLHLMLLVGFRNRMVVFIDWMWSYFSYERALRLIIRKYEQPTPANTPV